MEDNVLQARDRMVRSPHEGLGVAERGPGQTARLSQMTP